MAEKKAPKKAAAKPNAAAKPAAKTAAKPAAKAVYFKGNKQVNIYKITGSVDSKITLPRVFDTEYRPDLIKKGVKISRANRRQPYGPNPRSGMRHAASTWGKGRGVARVQRMTQGRHAVESPNNVGGRRAHPPIHDRDWSQKMNTKEKRLAKFSALAATSDLETVIGRGHMFNRKLTLPVVVSDNFEKIQKTIKVIDSLEKLGLYGDVLRSKNGRHVRAGRGKMRGRRYKTPKALLIIVQDKTNIEKAARNLSGVDVKTPDEINTELLAPGGDPGRLALVTEGALKAMGGW